MRRPESGLIAALLIALALVCGDSVASFAQQDPPIYGQQMMTEQERTEYRARMQAAQTEQERQQIRAEHHAQMQERARELGVELPDQPPAMGMGQGSRTSQGMGMGSGRGGGGAGRRGN